MKLSFEVASIIMYCHFTDEETENHRGTVGAQGHRQDTAELGFESRQAGSRAQCTLHIWHSVKGDSFYTGVSAKSRAFLPFGSRLGSCLSLLLARPLRKILSPRPTLWLSTHVLLPGDTGVRYTILC